METKIPNASGRTWITVPEAAEELHIPRTRAYELIQKGELPAVRIGQRSLRVHRAVLEQFLLAKRQVVAGAVEVKANPARAGKEAVGK